MPSSLSAPGTNRSPVDLSSSHEDLTLVVEPTPGELPKGEVMTDGFIMQLRTIGRKSPVANDIEHFLFHPSFPVDSRHNAKIHREELKAWAEGLLL